MTRRTLTALRTTFASLTVFLALVALLPGAASAAEPCPNEALREQQGSATLPDCRAYELVSPQDKNGGDVMGASEATRAAADGGAVQFSSLSGFADARGTGTDSEYMSIRTGAAGTTGWATHALMPQLEPTSDVDLLLSGTDPRYMGEMAPDLSKGVFLSNTPLTAGAPNVANAPNIYLRTDARTPGAGNYELLSNCTACTSPLEPTVEQPTYAGASADFSHVVFESIQDLTPEAAGLELNVPKLYEWANGTVRLAGILPDNECGGGTPPCAAPNSQAGRGAIYNSLVTTSNDQYAPNVISADGRRIFFTDRVNSEEGSLYMRVDNGTPQAFTVHINASERQPAESPQPAAYWGATSDGTKVLFTTTENLVNEDTDEHIDLYMYDANAPAGHHLTLISRPDPGNSAEVTGVLGMSDDGSYVYFTSETQLLASRPTLPSGDGVFVWHNGVIRQVGTIPNSADNANNTGIAGWQLGQKSSRVTPDGTRLAFVSQGSSEGPHSGAGDACPPEGKCREVFLYDATANGGDGQLTCASCHIPDAPAQTDAFFGQRFAAGVTGKGSHLNHPLSDDGRFVFFTSGDRLVAADHNNAPDVYEYDSQTARVNLLSSGSAVSEGSYFLDASTNGDDVFFLTRDRLNGWDGDNQLDLYDARVNGGLPEPAVALAACSGEGCQGSSAQTAGPTVATAGVSGQGNLAPPTAKRPLPAACRHGFVRRRVKGKPRCVRRHHSHARKHAATKRSGK